MSGITNHWHTWDSSLYYLHLRTILRNMEFCKNDVEAWNPDVLILVDYPGFNLKIAQYIKPAHRNPHLLLHFP